MAVGKFIVLEGINGCGKGTQLEFLAGDMHGADKDTEIFITREPNSFDENGRKAREMLKRDGDPYENAKEAVRYFAANRDAHNRIFVPMLKIGIDVICDRYWHSNFAFQGAQGVIDKDIAFANHHYRVPDLTLILDVPVEIAFERLAGRDGEKRRKFDSNKEFLGKVRDNYLKLPEISKQWLNEKNVYVINGNQDVEAVKKDIKSVYDSVFKSS
jgi:dTMP kinase